MARVRSFRLYAGLASLLLGAALAGWNALLVFGFETASGLVHWARTTLPLPWSLTAKQYLSDAADQQALTQSFFIALVFVLAGIVLGRGAMARQPRAAMVDEAGQSIELDTRDPLPGQPLEGRLVLAREVKPGDAYTLRLTCRARSESDSTQRVDVYRKVLDVQPVRRDGQWVLPFRFDIPADAPATAAGGLGRGGEWRLSSRQAGLGIDFAYGFLLHIGSAAPGTPRAVTQAERMRVATTDMDGLMVRGGIAIFAIFIGIPFLVMVVKALYTILTMG